MPICGARNLDRFEYFDGEPTTLVLTEQRRWKKQGRKEGVRKHEKQ